MSGALQIDMPEGHFQSRAVLVTGAHFDMRASHLLMAKAAWESVRPAEPAAEVAVGTSTVRVAESDHPPRPSSPFEVFVPVRGCAVEHPVTVPVSPAPPAARTRTEPSRVADDGALLIVPPSVPVDVTEDDVTEDALLPRAPAAAVQVDAEPRCPPLPAPRPSTFADLLDAGAEGDGTVDAPGSLRLVSGRRGAGAACSESTQDPLFTVFEEYMHAKGTGLPAPAHSLPPDANAADYNLMMDQLVSEADRLDVQFSTHLSLMDQRGDAEGVSAVALSTSLLDAGPSRGHTPAPDAAGSGVEGPAASASANRAEAGASTHAAMAGVDAPAATAGAASPDAADSDEDEDAGEELLESRIATRATRRAVASGQVVGRSALKPRKSMKDKKKSNRKCRNFCRNCGALSTPQWRCGPEGPRTLCNACGVRWRKGLPLKPKEEQPPAPAWTDEECWSEEE